MTKIILASSSPYRKALLERLGIQFDCVSPEVDEDQFKQRIHDPVQLAQTLAQEKTQAVAKQYPDAIVIGSDQLLDFQGQILGKAGSEQRAFKQLKLLSGRSHRLITAFSVSSPQGIRTQTNITQLKMRKLTDENIKNYLSSDNPIDCAGSYKLELKGIALFQEIITDDYTAIIGLPLLSVGNILAELGVEFPG